MNKAYSLLNFSIRLVPIVVSLGFVMQHKTILGCDNMKCVICKKTIEDKYGHMAEPVKKGMCCHNCNYLVVVPARMRKNNPRLGGGKDD